MKKLSTEVMEDLFRSKWGERTVQSAKELQLFFLHAKKFIAKNFPEEMVFDALSYTLFCLFSDVSLKVQRIALNFYIDVMEEKGKKGVKMNDTTFSSNYCSNIIYFKEI